ncbi:MAG: hypothetical protein RLW61_14660 [Gammaproteobacteria bacterium]
MTACSRAARLAALLLLASHAVTGGAVPILSDGSDGAFSGGGTLALDADGIFNFTTIHVTSTLSFVRNAANTPVVLAATGDVVIDGTVNVSAGDFGATGGPGGGNGGARGVGNQAGLAGDGPGAGGGGGPTASGLGNAGGGAGHATPGLQAVRYTNNQPGTPGGALAFGFPSGGSGGGGGSGAVLFGVPLDGGVGGGGGGGLLITTPGTITLNGSILADGGHAGWGFANVFANAGGGGGGSGGSIVLEATSIAVAAGATLSAQGGAGGGLSTQPVAFDPFVYSNGAHGGQGFVLFATPNLALDPAANIAATVVPLPAGLLLLAPGAALLLGVARHRRAT